MSCYDAPIAAEVTQRRSELLNNCIAKVVYLITLFISNEELHYLHHSVLSFRFHKFMYSIHMLAR